ncbi:hypothetical protein ACP70R_025313 [Stipagrostis hirtigluma subsp. patula]
MKNLAGSTQLHCSPTQAARSRSHTTVRFLGSSPEEWQPVSGRLEESKL